MEKKIEEIIQILRQDKRKCERVELAVIVYYRSPGELDWHGPFKAVNIGGGGISFILSKNIAKATELELRLVLPQEPQRPIELKAEVVWTTPLEGRFRLGLRFFKMREDDRRRFVAHICDTILAAYTKEE
jgi:c-di-GMP-binding flagellar brake protein YcgR